jgi:hypothetical protein
MQQCSYRSDVVANFVVMLIALVSDLAKRFPLNKGAAHEVRWCAGRRAAPAR